MPEDIFEAEKRRVFPIITKDGKSNVNRIQMQETYNLLSFWLDDWKRRLETPRELIFERSFVNVARAAAFSLEENYHTAPTKKIQRSAKGWGRKLLELLEETYAAHDPAIELLKLEYKTEVEELERQLVGDRERGASQLLE